MLWRLAIIEDNALLLSELAGLFSQHRKLECVLTASGLSSFFETWNAAAPIDVLLLDIALGEQNSLDYLAEIKKILPDMKVIIMTGKAEPELLLRALEEGADSYYRKGADLEQLLEVVDITLQGGVYIAPDAAPELLSFFRKRAQEKEIKVERYLEGIRKDYDLNEREMQVAEGLMAGSSYQEIANSHHISLNTVRHYVKALYRKLQVNNKVQLIRRLRPNQ